MNETERTQYRAEITTLENRLHGAEDECQRLAAENRRLRAWLEHIAEEAPAEEPEYAEWGGDTEDAEKWGLSAGAYEMGQHARRALAGEEVGS